MITVPALPLALCPYEIHCHPANACGGFVYSYYCLHMRMACAATPSTFPWCNDCMSLHCHSILLHQVYGGCQFGSKPVRVCCECRPTKPSKRCFQVSGVRSWACVDAECTQCKLERMLSLSHDVLWQVCMTKVHGLGSPIDIVLAHNLHVIKALLGCDC